MIVKFAFCKSLRGATASFGETARHTCWKGQERELRPDNLLKQKQTGLFLEDWQKGLVLGQELWLWWGLEHTRQWGLSHAREGYHTEFYIHLVPANV